MDLYFGDIPSALREGTVLYLKQKLNQLGRKLKSQKLPDKGTPRGPMLFNSLAEKLCFR